ncbi:hypothetical protein FHR34_007253 [Kitasatospora kifunensis]|uniref:Uncharacterized protein n=1 Tax=Kitasatospora kifunensis TaxID=58351 RepID=A0A7W7RA08_KITKI|nr:hypothetical protein [Kitasatospora kifunensis]
MLSPFQGYPPDRSSRTGCHTTMPKLWAPAACVVQGPRACQSSISAAHFGRAREIGMVRISSTPIRFTDGEFARVAQPLSPFV